MKECSRQLALTRLTFKIGKISAKNESRNSNYNISESELYVCNFEHINRSELRYASSWEMVKDSDSKSCNFLTHNLIYSLLSQDINAFRLR